jgi:hypothetical protein
MQTSKRTLVALSLLALGGCAGGPTTESTPGTLTLEQSGSDVRGTFVLDGEHASFEVTTVAPGTYDVMVRLHGMVLAAVVDPAGGTGNLDGFASTGGDTQILEADRATLVALSRALGTALPEATGAAGTLTHAVDLWADTPDSVPLERAVYGQHDRSWTSICNLYGTYQYATHDCWSYNDWDSRSTMIPHVGDRTTSTYYYVNNVWTTSVQDHRAYTYEWGDCYGNCGADCPSGAQQLTWDCLHHDSCVRNGHSLASLWCDDEFTSASDDELFAPDCSGT